MLEQVGRGSIIRSNRKYRAHPKQKGHWESLGKKWQTQYLGKFKSREDKMLRKE